VADIAEQVIYKAVEADPEATLRAVREALRELPGGGRVRVLVPEEDEETVTQHSDALLAVLRDAKDFRVVPDAKLERGGCVAYSDKSEIDARLETRLRAVRDEIERVVV
jgi:flagellar biosynthesis/type III secretory pathway protein FliH